MRLHCHKRGPFSEKWNVTGIFDGKHANNDIFVIDLRVLNPNILFAGWQNSSPTIQWEVIPGELGVYTHIINSKKSNEPVYYNAKLIDLKVYFPSYSIENKAEFQVYMMHRHGLLCIPLL